MKAQCIRELGEFVRVPAYPLSKLSLLHEGYRSTIVTDFLRLTAISAEVLQA